MTYSIKHKTNGSNEIGYYHRRSDTGSVVLFDSQDFFEQVSIVEGIENIENKL